jgi:hypothetical protein
LGERSPRDNTESAQDIADEFMKLIFSGTHETVQGNVINLVWKNIYGFASIELRRVMVQVRQNLRVGIKV